MAEDEASEADLSGRLATVLEEIRDVMEKRKQRIEELRRYEVVAPENSRHRARIQKNIYQILAPPLSKGFQYQRPRRWILD